MEFIESKLLCFASEKLRQKITEELQIKEDDEERLMEEINENTNHNDRTASSG